MGFEIIICSLLFIAIYLWISLSPKYVEPKEVKVFKPTPKAAPPKPEKENLTIPQKYRRWQQNMVGRENNVYDRETYQTFKEREMNIQEKGVALSFKEVELIDLANQIKNEKQITELERKEIILEIEGEKVEMKDLLNDIQHRENLLDLQAKEIRLDGVKVDLTDLLNTILHEGQRVELSKKELLQQQREVLFAYQRKAFELEKITQHIRTMVSDFVLEKKSWSIQKKQDQLEIYRNQIVLLENQIRQMYEIRMKWLLIQKKDNDLTNREQGLDMKRWENDLTNREQGLDMKRWENDLTNRESKLSIGGESLKLKSLYEATQAQIRQLQLDRDEIDTYWNKRELDDRWRKIKEIESNWYSGLSINQIGRMFSSSK